MARSIASIKQEIAHTFMEHETVKQRYQLDPNKNFEEQFSVVSIENILFYVMATTVWVLEKLFDTHRTEVVNIIDNLKPHSLRWYANMAKAYQFGFALQPDSDQFDNTNATADQIAASKVVAFAAVAEAETLLRVKVAGLDDKGNPAPLPSRQMDGLKVYMGRVKDAGVRLEFINEPADLLRLTLQIWYDPLVLTADGVNIQTGQAVIQPAVEAFLRNIPFDGFVVLAHLVDALQAIPGVVIPHIDKAEYQYADNDWCVFPVTHQAFSGYMRLAPQGLLVSYKAK